MNFVNRPATPTVCFVTKIKNGSQMHKFSNLQNKTNSSPHICIHIVHQFTAVEVAEMTESYVQNGQNRKNQLQNRELYVLSLTLYGLRRYFAQGEIQRNYLPYWHSVNFVNTAIFEVHKIQSLNIGGNMADGVVIVLVIVAIWAFLSWDRRDEDRRADRSRQAEAERIERVGWVRPYDRNSTAEILRQSKRMAQVRSGRRHEAQQAVLTVLGSPSDCNRMDFDAQIALADLVRDADPRLQVEFTQAERAGDEFVPLKGSGVEYKVRR